MAFDFPLSTAALRRLSLHVLLASACVAAAAQNIIPLPNTITTVAGGGATSTGTAAAPVACTTGSTLKSYDAFGNGCLGANTNFSSDLRGGVASDGQGNIYIADTSNSEVRKYDPKTGIVSRVAGKGTNCTVANGLLDSSGDGCPALTTSFASTPRGIATDPYGNVLFAGYGTQMVHIICTAASPLCPNITGRKQVGSMYRIAGCVGTIGSTATAAPTTNTILNTWAGTEGDNSFASPFSNLAGDASAGVTGTAAGGSCPGVNTNTGIGVLNQPRGVAADRFGNVYIAETAATGAGLRYRLVLGPQTSTFFSGNNPIWAIVNGAAYTSTAGNGTYTAHEGYIYTILGGFTGTPSAKGAACGAFSAEDSKGDGCPFTYSTANGGQQAVAVDDYGNVIFSDIANSLLRVLYVGGAGNPMATAIVANSFNTVTTPVPGNVYLLAGGGGTSPTPSPQIGSSLALPNQVFKVAVGPRGNLYLGDSSASQVFFFDIRTGFLRVLFKTGTPCAAHIGSSTNGEGCPVNSSSFSGSNGFGIAPDPLGNLYIADSTNALIRKVEASSLVPITVGAVRADASANIQTLVFHGPANTASMTANALNAPADLVVGTITCAPLNADNTTDCSVPVTFSPTQPGTRTVNLAVSALDASSNVIASAVFPVSGNAIGSALVTDTAVPATQGTTGIQPYGAAIDGAGNLYVVDTTNAVVRKIVTTSGASSSIGTAPANPGQVSVDNSGNVYVSSTNAGSATKFTLNSDGTYTSSAVTVPAIAAPRGIAIDPSGNAYVTDATTGKVFLVPATTDFNTQQPVVTIASGFTSPSNITLDGNGNLFVADATSIYKVANVNGLYTTTLYASGAGSPAVSIPGLVPAAITADAAGNVYVQDSTSKSIFQIPVNQTGPTTTTVITGLTTPTGVAVDGTGVVYSADAGAQTLTQIQRNALTFDFGTSTSLIFSVVVSNAGNLTATGPSPAGLDLSDFPFTSVAPSNCFNTPFTPGYACSLTAQFTPGSGSGVVGSHLSFLAAASTTGYLQLTGTKTGSAVTSTTTIGAQNPTTPIYAASGTEVSFPITVTASDSSIPGGFVNVSIDSGANTPYTITAGAVTVPLSGLSAGPHTFVVAYPSQGGITGSTSAVTNFTIAQATTTTNWTPAATTQQFSAAIGAGVLNAAAVVTGGNTAVPGYYLYTATPTGGSPITVHAASYLPIGAYGLAVTFIPTDTTNFVGSTSSVAGYTVTKASTTAAVGTSQLVVAADGTGNFSSIQAAVNTIPATGGGAVYIKPGTYTENVAVVQPNVSLRGLGGDPNAVVLTHAAGAFGGTGVYSYAGEFTTAQTNGYQLPAGSTRFNGDEGSATLVVAKGINTAVGSATLIPNNFYAENFTLANTYNTDTNTTTTTYLPDSSGTGTCAANQGPARTYNYLFNNGIQCASQALAIWTTSDLSVMNNIYSTSLQDTIYAGSQGSGSSGYVPARQYWFRGKVIGTVDYLFGDAAAVFDYSTFYTVPHGANGIITGSATIEAQNKATQTSSGSDYLSGYVVNSNVFTSLIAGQTGLYFGRPYGQYSTWVMLNSYIDQVNPLGYFEFSNGTSNLPSSTYTEFNNIPYTDPATGSLDINGVPYLGNGGATGAGVNGTRETVSQNPGTPMAINIPKTSMTAAQATLYYPTAFLSKTVSSTLSPTQNWNPTAAIAASVNAFVPATSVTSSPYGKSLTILLRPQTPGLGAVTNGVYTIPTGTYTLYDGGNVLASGSLDAAGEAFYTTASLAPGAHNLTWTYSGDANFSGSTTATALAVTITSAPTTVTLLPASQTITYGQSLSLTASAASTGSSYVPTGNVTLSVDGVATQTLALSSGSVSFTVNGLLAGSHSVSAAYAGDTNASNSTSGTATATVNKAALTITGTGVDRIFGAPNNISNIVGGYQYTDTAATVFTVGPSQTTTATRVSPVGTYSVVPNYTLSTFGAANYLAVPLNGSFKILGGAAQVVTFAPLPNLTHGASYQLTAHATSGLPIAYTVTTGSGIATVTGSTLTITGAGPVTVQATQTDSTGTYATATASRSFTAQ